MIMCLVLLGLLVVTAIVCRIADITRAEGWTYASVILIVLSVTVLIIVVGSLIFDPIEDLADIEAFRALERTLANARENGVDLEDAALQVKIAGMNEWLAKAQFWAKHPLTNWFRSKALLELEPMR